MTIYKNDTIAQVIHLLSSASLSKEPLLVMEAYNMLTRLADCSVTHCQNRKEQIVLLFDTSCFCTDNIAG